MVDTSVHPFLKDIGEISQLLESASLPEVLRTRLDGTLTRLRRMSQFGGYAAEYESMIHYMDWVVNLPWNQSSQDVLDLERTKQILEKNHYGMGRIKDRILEYVSVLKLVAEQSEDEVRQASVLFLVGLPGLGKTSIASSIAEALGRKFVRVPFGGLGDVRQLRGVARHQPAAEPGQLIKGLRRAETNNPVLLLDEIDRVAEGAQAAVMGALLEILDPEQNDAFMDYFIGYPFDLSGVLFVCSANNIRGISNAVLDRLEVIDMPSYTDEEKIVIGRDYLFPKALAAAGLREGQVQISEELWPKIVRPLGFDAGIRSLNRTIQGICRKVARRVVESGGREQVFMLTEENIKEFLPAE